MTTAAVHSLRSRLTMRLRRPFSNAHWTLLAVLVVAWVLAMLGAPCGSASRDTHVALATFTVCAALWASHLRARHHAGWRQVAATLAGAGYDLVVLLVACVLGSILLYMLTEGGSCYSPKAKVSELILATSSARTRIAERVENTHTLAGAGTGITIAIEGRTKAATVRPDGTILVAGDDPPAVVIIQPTLVDGELRWQCIGLPASLMPGSCR